MKGYPHNPQVPVNYVHKQEKSGFVYGQRNGFGIVKP